jgi:hypothetical protein
MLYIFGMLALMLLFNAVMRVAKRRWPDISAVRMFFWVLGAAMCMDVVIQVPAILLRLWAFPNLPISLFSQDVRYPLADLFGFSPFFATMAMLRFYKDDRGRTVVERGLDHLSARRRTLVSLLAVIGFANAAYVAFSLPDVWMAPYSSYMAKNTPAHLMNGICDDATTVKGSKYGPCPGMPGYRMPLRDINRYKSEGK